VQKGAGTRFHTEVVLERRSQPTKPLPLLYMISSINKLRHYFMFSGFIHLIRFCVDNARVFQQVFMNLKTTVGQAAC